MKLSIVIVNYNVKYFLKQCIQAAEKAIQSIDAEIFVVDNKSTDGSVEMIKECFPNVILIDNKENVGFSKANNQAIKIAKGEYVLLLNPDTIVAEDTFEKVIAFMDATPKAGGLGVKMIDGNGNFLPESKRGLPTPEVAFYKIFGLSTLFPKSKRFSKYHLGYLSNEEINPIDVLSGAFMFLRRETLDAVGLLDETFFMYGEDIDLSYRITLGGYENYYFPKSTIVHYKGESTKKSSVNYVFIFYKAMAIFAEKHFGKNRAGVFNFLIKIAIFFRATLALINRFVEIAFLPLLDASILFLSLHFVKRLYQDYSLQYYDSLTTNLTFLVFCFIMLISLLYNGAYDKPVRLSRIIKGVFVAIPFVFGAFLIVKPGLHFNALQAILTIIGAGFIIIGIKLFLHFIQVSPIKTITSKKHTLISGKEEENSKIETLIGLTQPNASTLFLKIESENIFDLFKAFLRKKKSTLNEIVFCPKSIPYKKIIQLMEYYAKQKIEFKIAYPEDTFIIGSTNLNTAGELYILKLKGIKSAENIRLKRTLDVLFSALLLVTLPFHVFLFQNKSNYVANLCKVLKGKISFVGYSKEGKYANLPHIANGILSFYDVYKTEQTKNLTSSPNKLNKIYAYDYSVFFDIKTIYYTFRSLDKKVS